MTEKRQHSHSHATKLYKYRSHDVFNVEKIILLDDDMTMLAVNAYCESNFSQKEKLFLRRPIIWNPLQYITEICLPSATYGLNLNGKKSYLLIESSNKGIHNASR